MAAPVPGEQLVRCRTPICTYPAQLGLCPDMIPKEEVASERESRESRETAGEQRGEWLPVSQHPSTHGLAIPYRGKGRQQASLFFQQ